MSWVMVGVAAAGAIAGKMKNDAAKKAEDADRKLAAETQKYSPWTGMQAGPIRRAGSEFGDMFSGGVQGAMMGQSLGGAMGGQKMEGAPMAGGEAGMGAQEMGQTMSPWEKMNQQKKPMWG